MHKPNIRKRVSTEKSFGQTISSMKAINMSAGERKRCLQCNTYLPFFTPTGRVKKSLFCNALCQARHKEALKPREKPKAWRGIKRKHQL